MYACQEEVSPQYRGLDRLANPLVGRRRAGCLSNLPFSWKQINCIPLSKNNLSSCWHARSLRKIADPDRHRGKAQFTFMFQNLYKKHVEDKKEGQSLLWGGMSMVEL